MGFERPARMNCFDDCDEYWTDFTNAGGLPPSMDATKDGGFRALEVAKNRLEREIDFFGVTECFETSLNIANAVLGWDPAVTKRFLDEKMAQSNADYDDVTTANYQIIRDKNAIDAELVLFGMDVLKGRAKTLNIDVKCEDPHEKTSTAGK